MVTIGIYAIRSPSGKFYIGSSVHVERRRRQHFNMLRAGKHHCLPLQHAFNKYGENSLTFDVLEVCTRDALLDKEQAFMNALGRAGMYNVCPQAGNGSSAFVTPEGRRRQAEAIRGRKHSAEAKSRMSVAKQGVLHSAAAKAKISAANSGRTWKEDDRARRAESLWSYSRSDNESGFRGVSRHRDKWSAKIQRNGKRVFLGLFDTPEAANAAILAHKDLTKTR